MQDDDDDDDDDDDVVPFFAWGHWLIRCGVTENDIVGEALVALLHDDLKSMGIASVGHRLTILKSVYDVKKAQDIPIESDHYLPLCKASHLALWIMEITHD